MSVVIPCFNAEHTIAKAIRSLLNQTYVNIEIIIINDGSTDRTKSIINKFSDSRIKYFEFIENKGRGAARQKGLDESNGVFLAMVDADDWVYSSKIEKQVKFLLENEEIVLISSGMGIVDQNDVLIGKRTYKYNIIKNKGLGMQAIPHASSMIRMDVAKKHSYNVNLKYSQDSDFILKCTLHNTYCISDGIEYIYTEHTSVTKRKILTSYFYTIKYLSTYLNKYPIRSLIIILITILKALIFSVRGIFVSTENILKARAISPNKEDLYKYAIEKKKNSV